MPDITPDARAIVDAVQDLTRLTVALHGNFASKSDAVRRLADLTIPPARIAGILSMSVSDVQSVLAKAKKRDAASGAAATEAIGSGDGVRPSGRRSASRTEVSAAPEHSGATGGAER